MTTALRLELRADTIESVESWQIAHRLRGDEPHVMTRRKLRKESP